MLLRQIFDPYLAQYAYLVGCQRSGEALIIDPERDVDQYQRLAAQNGLRITAVAETHIHADFVSGAAELAADPDMKLYLSKLGGPDWTYQWTQGRGNVTLLGDGDAFRVGNIRVEAVHTPGHTPEHLSFLITDEGGGADQPVAVATGDFLFVGDVGRPDLLETAAGVQGVKEASAMALRESLAGRFSGLKDWVQVLPAHGAGSACGKALGAIPISTIGYERHFNAPFRQALADGEAFVGEILRGQPEPPPYFATMKRVNRDGIAVTGGVPPAPVLQPAKVRELIGRGAVVVLDARDSRDAFASGTLPGGIHVPLHGPYFSAGAGSYLEEEDTALLVVERAADAELAARQLYRIGFDRIAGWLTMETWRAAGYEAEIPRRIRFEEFNPDAAIADGAVILDVRTASEFEAGHLEGAVNIPYTRLRLRLDELDGGKRIYVHCGSGNRASLAASFLCAKGFTDVVFVDGVCAECERIALAQGVTH